MLHLVDMKPALLCVNLHIHTAASISSAGSMIRDGRPNIPLAVRSAKSCYPPVLLGDQIAHQSSKKERVVQQCSCLCRRGKGFYDLGNKTGNPVDYLNAHEDLSALNKPNDEAIKIIGLCHAIILQVDLGFAYNSSEETCGSPVEHRTRTAVTFP